VIHHLKARLNKAYFHQKEFLYLVQRSGVAGNIFFNSMTVRLLFLGFVHRHFCCISCSFHTRQLFGNAIQGLANITHQSKHANWPDWAIRSFGINGCPCGYSYFVEQFPLVSGKTGEVLCRIVANSSTSSNVSRALFRMSTLDPSMIYSCKPVSGVIGPSSE
jgi:hypothetical protein